MAEGASGGVGSLLGLFTNVLLLLLHLLLAKKLVLFLLLSSLSHSRLLLVHSRVHSADLSGGTDWVNFLTTQSIGIDELTFVAGILSEEITRNSAHVIRLHVHLRWVTRGHSVEVERAVFGLDLRGSEHLPIHSKPLVSTESHSVNVVIESHGVSQGTWRETSLLLMVIILMTGGLESDGRMAVGRETSVLDIAVTKIRARQRRLAC